MDLTSYRIPTYWTDSEDVISEGSSCPGFEVPLNRTSTLKRPMRSVCEGIRSHFPISSTNPSPVKQTPANSDEDSCTPPKHACLGSPYKSRLVSMGAGVKQHSAYYRRRSMGEITAQGGEEPASTTPALAPVCPIPIPAAFTDRLGRSHPTRSPLSRNVETQTTPPVDQTPCRSR